MENLSKSSISIKNKYSNELLPLVLAIGDYIAIWLAVNVSYSLRDFLVPGSHFHLSWLSIHVIIPVVYILFLQLHHLYTRRMQFWQVISGIFKSVFYAIALLIFFIYIAQTAASTSRLFVALLWLTSFFFLVADRYLIKHILGHFKMLQLPVLIMGGRQDGGHRPRIFQERYGHQLRFHRLPRRLYAGSEGSGHDASLRPF